MTKIIDVDATVFSSKICSGCVFLKAFIHNRDFVYSVATPIGSTCIFSDMPEKYLVGFIFSEEKFEHAQGDIWKQSDLLILKARRCRDKNIWLLKIKTSGTDSVSVNKGDRFKVKCKVATRYPGERELHRKVGMITMGQEY